MKIQWDPYTGQFIDVGTFPSPSPPAAPHTVSHSSCPIHPSHLIPHHSHHPSTQTTPGDDEPIEEIGVPARNKPTGLKPEELKGGGGSVAKANAYLAQQMVRAGLLLSGPVCACA